MLQVIKCPAVCDRRNHCGELQRRQRDALADEYIWPTPPSFPQSLAWIRSEVLALYVISG